MAWKRTSLRSRCTRTSTHCGNKGCSPDGWSNRLPNHSTPWTSTIVFVVRRGNPLDIRDWPDLVRAGVSVITPNPKTSGNGKLSLLAAWGSVVYRGGNEAQARDYLRRLYRHVLVLATGSRESATSFADEEMGDMQLSWENEAIREVEDSKGDLKIVYPPVSILAEPSVAWVDSVVTRRQSSADAKAYLEFLYTAPAQEMVAHYGYRPIDPVSLLRIGDGFKNSSAVPLLDAFDANGNSA